MGRAELSVNSSPLWVKSSGQACDFAILNQLSITRQVLRPGRPRVQTAALLAKANVRSIELSFFI